MRITMGCLNPSRVYAPGYKIQEWESQTAILNGDEISCAHAAAMDPNLIHPNIINWGMTAGFMLLFAFVLLLAYMVYEGRDWE